MTDGGVLQDIALSTADLLAGLEAAGRINSAEDVYRRAEDAGRYASRLQTAREENARGLAAVRRLLDSGD